MRTDSTTLLCLACYQDRLASVFEMADEYKLFDIRDNEIYPAGLLSLPSKDPMDRTSAILACGVSFLLCGALCRREQISLEQGGVTVISWISGTVDEVLAAFPEKTYGHLSMPGCRDRFGFAKQRRRSSDTGEVRRQRRLHRHGSRRQSPPSGSAI